MIWTGFAGNTDDAGRMEFNPPLLFPTLGALRATHVSIKTEQHCYGPTAKADLDVTGSKGDAIKFRYFRGDYDAQESKPGKANGPFKQCPRCVWLFDFCKDEPYDSTLIEITGDVSGANFEVSGEVVFIGENDEPVKNQPVRGKFFLYFQGDPSPP